MLDHRLSTRTNPNNSINALMKLNPAIGTVPFSSAAGDLGEPDARKMEPLPITLRKVSTNPRQETRQKKIEHTSGFSQQIIVPKLTSPQTQYRGSLASISSRTPSSSIRKPWFGGRELSGSCSRGTDAFFLTGLALRRP